jgi:hypothetical protein
MRELFLVFAIGAGASAGSAMPCNNATLQGEYGLQFTGTRPSGPGAPIESVMGIVYRRYDGHGGFTENHNVKGSIAGLGPQDELAVGTYQVNDDCTGTVTILPAANRPFPIIERIIIVNDGEEVLGISTAPALLMAPSVAKRISNRQASAIAEHLNAIRANVGSVARRLGLVPKE